MPKHKLIDGCPVLIIQGTEYLLVNDTTKEGAIATVEQYESFTMNFAHLMEDGRIMRYGQQIVTRDEITWIMEEE